MSAKISDEVYKMLQDIIKKVEGADLVEGDKLEMTVDDPNKMEDGFLGELIDVSFKNTRSGQIFDFVIKKAFTNQKVRDEHPVRSAFLNEMYYYTKIYRTLYDVQEGEVCLGYYFYRVPKCFGTISEENSELLILEHLKWKGFEVHNKKMPLDKERYERVLKEYGKFHSLSFAYREFYPEKFEELTNGLIDVYSELGKNKYFEAAVIQACKAGLESLQPGVDDKVIEAFKDFPETCMKQYFESLAKDSEPSVILHGDCSSNNIMFSYNKTGNVNDVRLIDFQLVKVGSPCCDISYSIYSGASKEVLDNLNYYLKVYYKSLRATLRNYNECGFGKLYSYKQFKKDWKKYCKFGLLMGLMAWRKKMEKDSEMKDSQDEIGQDDINNYYSPEYDEEGFKEVARNLFIHFYKNNFL